MQCAIVCVRLEKSHTNLPDLKDKSLRIDINWLSFVNANEQRQKKIIKSGTQKSTGGFEQKEEGKKQDN